MLANMSEYKESLSRVVGIIANARVNAVQKASAEMVRMYWETGAVLNKNAAYGTAFIESLSRDIRAAFPGIKGFSVRSLRYMAKFAREVDSQFCSGYCRIRLEQGSLLRTGEFLHTVYAKTDSAALCPRLSGSCNAWFDNLPGDGCV